MTFRLILLSILALTPIVFASAARGDDAWPEAAREGETAYEEGRFDAAVAAYEAALEAGTRRAEVAYNLGVARFRTAFGSDSLATPGEGAAVDSVALRDALGDWRRAAAAGGREIRPGAFYNQATAELGLGNLQGARELYREVLRLDPADDDARYNLELVERLLAEQEGEPSEDSSDPEGQEPQESSEGESDPNEGESPSGDEESPSDPSGTNPEDPQEDPQSGDDEPPEEPGQDPGDQEDPGADEESSGTTPEETDPSEGDAAQAREGGISPEEARRELERLEEAERENLKALLRERRGRASVEKDW